MHDIPFRRSFDVAGSGLDILILDNCRDAADSLADLLGLCGHQASAVYGARDALAAAPRDVLILELRLVGTDGWELVRRMHARTPTRRTSYIAVTTCGRSEDRRRSEEAGIEAHLVKPVEIAELLGALRRSEGRRGDRGHAGCN